MTLYGEFLPQKAYDGKAVALIRYAELLLNDCGTSLEVGMQRSLRRYVSWKKYLVLSINRHKRNMEGRQSCIHDSIGKV